MKFASTIETLSAETIVINTGARPTGPSIDGLDDVDVHDSTDLLERASIPLTGRHRRWLRRLWYAQMYSRFGADVTVFQRGDTLLPDEDPDVSEVIETAFEKRRNHRPDRYASDGTHGDQRRHPCRRRCRRHRLRHRLGRCCPRSGAEHRIRTASSSKTSARHWTRTDSSRPTTASERLLTVSTPLAT